MYEYRTVKCCWRKESGNVSEVMVEVSEACPNWAHRDLRSRS
jgi:hypothetical protein